MSETAMTQDGRLKIIGNTGSPYTRKMLALLRYRHIPYDLIWADPKAWLPEQGIEAPRPTLLPVLLFPAEAGAIKAECDSTPLIRKLESQYEGRSVLPDDPALAFLDYLLEDFGDEWCTKYMFHYRWHFEKDADNAGTLLPLGLVPSMPTGAHQQFKEIIAQRQIERLYVVGSNDVTAPVIDASYRRFLKAMDTLLEEQPFLLGNRPGAGDFSIYGQLTQLIGFDPTPRAIAHVIAPRTVGWVSCMEDHTGLNGDEAQWCSSEAIPAGLKGLLTEMGRGYVPTLLANAKAVEAGEKNWETEIDGLPWTQQTFPYQAKCLRWINEQYHGLGEADRARVDAALSGTGCEALIV
ncbi:MAG: glutathione S-transferase N-terminal domain-containing protein [Halioglobus sp.]